VPGAPTPALGLAKLALPLVTVMTPVVLVPLAKSEVWIVETTFGKSKSETMAVDVAVLWGSPAVKLIGDPAKHACDAKTAVVLQLAAVTEVEGPAHMR
jgi:hypothetical protein